MITIVIFCCALFTAVTEDMTGYHADDWDELHWKQYEKMVAAVIAGQLIEESGSHDVKWNEKYPYDYGEKQIDVLVKSKDGDGEVTTLVECKHHDNRIEQDILASMAFYLQHSDADQAVVVSKNGFQEGARNIAEGCGIRIFEIGELEDEEDDPRPIFADMEVTLGLPEYRHVVRVHPASESPYDNWKQLHAFDLPGDPLNIEILDPGQNPTGETVREYLDAETDASEETGKIFTEFDGELVEIDGEYYTLLEGVSQKNPEQEITSEHLLEIAEDVEIKLTDSIDECTGYRSSHDIKRDILHVDTD